MSDGVGSAARAGRAPVVRGRRDWVDVAKGVAIVLVIAYHCTLFLRSIEFEAGGMGRLKTAVELLPMPVFLLTAGVFHARVVQWSLADTWKRRLRGYAYLYLLWSVLRFAFYLLVPNVRSDGAGGSATSVVALLGVAVWPISSYWFIWSLFVLTLVLWLVRRVRPVVVLSAAAVVSVAASSGLVGIGNVGWDRTLEYAVFFLAGALWARRTTDLAAAAPWWLITAGLLLWGGASATAAYLPGSARVPGLVLLGQIGAVAFTVCLAQRLAHVRALGWVGYLGARSLHLYLIHVFVIAALAIAVVQLRDAGVLLGRGTSVLVVMTVVVTAAAVLLGKLLGRFRWLFVAPRPRGAGASAPGRRAPSSTGSTGSTGPVGSVRNEGPDVVGTAGAAPPARRSTT